LNVVSFSDFTLLDELEGPWKADTAGEPETQTSGINWRETLKVGVLSESVVSLAEGDARAAASDQAGIDWREASEESTSPAVWASCWLCDGFWLVQGILETSNPGINIVGIDSSRYSVLWSSHLDLIKVYIR